MRSPTTKNPIILFYPLKKLNYLIIGDKPTNKKVNLARELSINIINQDDLKKMLD